MICYSMKKNYLCTDKINGIVTTRKCLELLIETLSIFEEHYLLMMERYAYHNPHFVILGKNETAKDKNTALKFGDIETTRDTTPETIHETRESST